MEAGLLDDQACKREPPLLVRTDPITDTYAVEARPFARGKFASVRRCRHLGSGAEFAAKSMRKRRRAQDVRHEIMHEAHVLRLSSAHPHIVRMHEVYETPSEIVLVLELVPGGELQRVLDDEEVVEEREAARLLRQILDGVAFLHRHKIAHLDLKPQNLLLTKPFPEGEVKLCDFGISRLISKGVEIREIVGTPDYVAPEVLHYEPISLPTDMWSLGVLTYVLLSGHSPFGGDSKQETFCNITRGALEFPPDLFAATSPDAIDFIRRLLLRNPRERMTAEECLSHKWLTGGTHPSGGIHLTLSPGGATQDSRGPDSPDSKGEAEGDGGGREGRPQEQHNGTTDSSKRNGAVCLEKDTDQEAVRHTNILHEGKEKRLLGARDHVDTSQESVHTKIPLLPHKGCVSVSPKVARTAFCQSQLFQSLDTEKEVKLDAQDCIHKSPLLQPSDCKGVNASPKVAFTVPCHSTGRIGESDRDGSQEYERLSRRSEGSNKLHEPVPAKSPLLQHNGCVGRSPSPKVARTVFGQSQSFQKAIAEKDVELDMKDGGVLPDRLLPRRDENEEPSLQHRLSKSPSPKVGLAPVFCQSHSLHRTSETFTVKSLTKRADAAAAAGECGTVQQESKSRSVDMVVSQFEGMSKRIVFSEEIIVDERVGMVY